jgi:hypothetical protein
MPSKARFACLTLSLLALSGAARAETTDCTEITGVPYNITTAGVYCLKSSLTLGHVSTAIRVNASNVTVDLNGHTLDLAAGAAGVGSSISSNVTVRNGTIRGGAFGVQLQATSGVVVSGNLVERLRVENSSHIGITVNGHGGAIRNNVVIGIGGDAPGARYGIAASSGTGLRVSDNQVVNMVVSATGGQVDAISVVDAPGAVIERNLVSNTRLATPSGPGLYPIGIHVYRTASFFMPMKTVVAGNHVFNMRRGIDSNIDVTSLFLDNTVGGAETPFAGGVMAGSTNYSF